MVDLEEMSLEERIERLEKQLRIAMRMLAESFARVQVIEEELDMYP